MASAGNGPRQPGPAGLTAAVTTGGTTESDRSHGRIWGILRELAAAGLIVLADTGCQGAGEPLIIPYRGRNKPASQKDANTAHARLRAPGERAKGPAQDLADPAQAPLLPRCLCHLGVIGGQQAPLHHGGYGQIADGTGAKERFAGPLASPVASRTATGRKPSGFRSVPGRRRTSGTHITARQSQPGTLIRTRCSTATEVLARQVGRS
jgi:hypothetical protein